MQTNHSMRYFFESGIWSNGTRELFSMILRDLFCNLMASVSQNVRENPQHAAWNNNNTEFEGGRQNMMGFSCISVYMKAVYKYTFRVHSKKILSLYPIFRCRSLTTKPASQQRNTSKKYRRSDLIRCLAVLGILK